MVYDEDDYLLLSGIQHFCFCKRQWALIHLEQQWADNEATAHGQVLHQKADNPYIKESRKDLVISRAVQVSSKRLGLYGVLDVLEFQQTEDQGVSLPGKRGFWKPKVVEYKRGKPKKGSHDIVQLVAQTMCLEEMLSCSIDVGGLYYYQVNKRIEVGISDALREFVITLSNEMHEYFQQRAKPKAEYFKNCSKCSLVDVCMPRLSKKRRSIEHYIQQSLLTMEDVE